MQCRLAKRNHFIYAGTRVNRIFRWRYTGKCSTGGGAITGGIGGLYRTIVRIVRQRIFCRQREAPHAAAIGLELIRFVVKGENHGYVRLCCTGKGRGTHAGDIITSDTRIRIGNQFPDSRIRRRRIDSDLLRYRRGLVTRYIFE